MASPDLPLWAWNLIIAVQCHEDQHASSDHCLKGILAAIPPEVRSQAEAISIYVQKARGDEVADRAVNAWTEMLHAFFPKASSAGMPEPEATS